ncbi:rCG61663 [Rattus norvegicus]|uniref:RCG61663 n=1 Tax=Rattus norvegicus TaxID=10116 RepID=A6HBZ9_RAT|nr:rCG61663 [Rattus norvegicus]
MTTMTMTTTMTTTTTATMTLESDAVRFSASWSHPDRRLGCPLSQAACAPGMSGPSSP